MAEAPYPGLRSFERYEADIFFGRETHIDTMIDRLAAHRFLAVTGSSGSGKSSLVKAGLFQGLEMGLVARAGSNWRIATMRPGEHPMIALGTALAEVLVGQERGEASAERGPLSMLAELRERPLPGSGNLLILVDQFEELFRYRGLETRDEAEAFVALLLGARRVPESRVYVVLTMRSDFLGQCAQFEGLAETVTDSLYLCPRLDRDQIAAAIERPAAVFGGRVEPELVERMIGEMGADPDQLPLLQHALLRLWDSARSRNPAAPVLTLADYDAADGLRGSLSQHADEILATVTADNPARKTMARQIFCLLVEGEGEAAVRRPSAVAEVVAVSQGEFDEVAAIAAPFRASGANFLSPAAGQKLAPETKLDISHESLIRQWRTLREWARDEAASAEQYRELSRRARRWNAGEADLLGGTELDLALTWREHEHPSAAWASRYGNNFDLAMRFLDESAARRDDVALRHLRSRRAVITVLALLVVVFGALAWFGLHQAQMAQRQTAAAQKAEAAANLHLEEARLAQSHFLGTRAEDTLKSGDAQLAGLIARAALTTNLADQDWQIWFRAMTLLADARAADRELAALTGHTRPVLVAVFSPDGSEIVTASDDHTARLWDAQTGAPLATLKGHEQTVRSAAFSPDGTRIVTASDDDTARLWDAKTGSSLATLAGHTSLVLSAAFSPDGARIVTASNDNTVRLWDAKTGAPLATLEGHTDYVLSAAFSPDGKRIVTASDDRTARLWDAETGTAIATLTGHTDIVLSAAFSPDGTRIVTTSSDHTARLWDAKSGAALTNLTGHTGQVLSAAFNPDGTQIVTASADGTARVWNALTGAALITLTGHADYVRSVAFSPDGTRIATASDDGTARLWDAETGTVLAKLIGHDGQVLSAAFSPDGTRVVTTSADHTARLWDTKTGAALATLAGHTDYVRSAMFSPDGTRIVTASADNTARLWTTWPLLSEDTVVYADIAALRTLTAAERASLFLDAPTTASASFPEPTDPNAPGAICDRQAADWFDPHRKAPGVLLHAIDSETAIAACQAAIAASPSEFRFSYELGRALESAEEFEDAVKSYRAASDKLYAAAADQLASAYLNGQGVAQDQAAALRLYRQAAQGGFLPAYAEIAQMYWNGFGVAADPAEAVRWLERGASAGDPMSHRRLAELYETGDGVTRDLAQALLHRAIEVRLLEASGADDYAMPSRLHRGADARALPPEVAVRIAHQAADWKPALVQ